MGQSMKKFYTIKACIKPSNKITCDWLVDWLVVLRHSQHKIGHFGDVPQATILASYGKTKPNITKAHIHNHMKCTTTRNKHKKLKPGLVASYDIQPGNGEGLCWFRHFHKFVTYLLGHLPTYLQEWDPHWANKLWKCKLVKKKWNANSNSKVRSFNLLTSADRKVTDRTNGGFRWPICHEV